MESNQRTNKSYTIAWVCALPIEQAAAQGMLDERHPNLPNAKDDTNNYRFGRIGEHDIVIAVLKSAGTTPAAVAATNLLRSFPNIRFGLMVGIGGGAPGRPHKDPQKDIRLGDVVVSDPSGEYGGVIQYDLGKSLDEGKFIRTGNLNNPPAILGTAVAGLRGDALLDGYQIQSLVDTLVTKYPTAGFHYPGHELDRLFASNYSHIKDDEGDDDDCIICEDKWLLQRKQRKDPKTPAVHYGLIGSANQVLRNSEFRDRLRQDLNIMCFEMEAGGLMNDFPCLVVRGICDYCDSHKNKQWQPYAAAVAAAYAKQLLEVIAPAMVSKQRLARDVTGILEVQTLALGQLKDSVAKTEAKLDLKGLPTVPNAAFDSHVDYDEQDSICLIGTRTDILQKIQGWVIEAGDRSIFWLNGMAGTGKSTIARTTAEEFAKRKQLGASFFFKRGEGDRQSCRYLFTTIASQLAQSLPSLRQAIATAIDENPEIGHKALKEQFDNLILSPIKANISQLNSPVVIVIDALDECIDQDKMHIIIGLLSEFRSVESQNIRILLTSRREQVLNESFKEIAIDVFEDIILHEITETTIEQDISRYLEYKFDQIRTKKQYELSMDWPGHEMLKLLTAISSPLFIFAATICRFVGDRRADPKRRLQSVLERRRASLDKLQQTYQPILEALLEVSGDEEDNILQDFHSIVGPIVVLVEPLTAFTLSKLLKIKHDKINFLVRQLHSVLRISINSDLPIRTLHASFSDYLLYPHQSHSFRIDACTVHGEIALRCLDILQFSDCLSKGDICGLKNPGFARKDIDVSTINEKLPTEIRYACCYWVHHLKESSYLISVIEDQICTFLEKRFLFWFEALSLFGRAREAISMLSDLSSLFSGSTSPSLKATISDARRFAISNSYIADLAPLQLYSSCIIFSPQNSIVRTNFSIPAWLKRTPRVPDEWSALLQTLEGQWNITSLTYSPDGKLLVSTAHDQTIKIWETSSGQRQQTPKQMDGVSVVAFSPNSKLLASGSQSGAIRFWCVALNQLLQTFIAHSDYINAITFSPDGKLLASGSSDHTIKLWSVDSGELRQALKGHLESVVLVAFSPNDGKLLASSSWDHTIKLWDIASGKLQHTIEGYSVQVPPVFCFLDDKLLAFPSDDDTIKLWDVASGEVQYSVMAHLGFIKSITFSSNRKLLASGCTDGVIKICDMTSGRPVLRQTLSTNRNVASLAFGPDGKILASTCDETSSIQLWTINLDQEQQQLAKEHSFQIRSLAFSPDGKLLVSTSDDDTIKLYAVISGQIQLQHTFIAPWSYAFKSYAFGSYAVAFSPDSKLLAFGLASGAVRIWSFATGQIRRTLHATEITGSVYSVAYSSNGKLLAACSYGRWANDGIPAVWDIDSGQLLHTLRGHSESPLVAVSSDGKLLASRGGDDHEIKIWETDSGQLKLRITTPGLVNKLSFDDELSLLQTNLGSIDIGRDRASARQHWTDPAKHDKLDDWILRYGQKLLWLPPEYRSAFAYHGDLIALGLSSGRIVLLEFSSEKLDFNDEIANY